jgi:PAS domain S-box-containing protein
LAAGAGLVLAWRQQQVRSYRAQYETAELLRKSQEQYSELIEHASDGIFIADSSRKYVEVNPSGCAMLGYSRDEILTKQISDLIAPDDMVTARTILGEWQQGKTMLTQWRLIRKDGSPLPVEISGRMLPDGRFQSIIRDITERKQTEEKILVSEMRYRRLFEAARDGILILDAETGMIVDVNPFMIELLGFSREVFFEKKIWELGFFKDIAANKAKFKKLLQKEYIRYENLPLETAQGRRINVEFVSNVYQVDHHKVIQCNIRDITERKQAEDAKQQSELLIRTLYELSPDSIMLIDPNDPNVTWPIIDCNATACLMNGYLRDELIGRSIDIVNENPYIPTEKTVYLKKLREAGNLKYEAFHRHKNGTVFPVEISTTIIKVGERELVIGIDRDITERVQAEKKLAWEQYLLGAMLDTLPDHIYFKDRQSRFTRISKSLAEMFGSGDPAKVMGKTDFDFFTEEHARPAFEVEQNIIATGQPVIGLEEKETWPDGQVTWVDTIKMPLLDQAGNIIGTFGSSRNITERKQAEEQIANYTEHLEEIVDERTRELRQAQEKLVRQERLATLGQLAGSVGHELRNPLGVISNAVYFLKMVQPDANETVLEYLDIIENETHASDKIVTDLLDFTRIKSVDREPAEVSELVHQTLERYPVPRSVKVALKIPADLPPIFADPRQVVQVLGNLVTNAFQAMPDGGKLTLSASVEGAMMVVAVRDTGTGISTENMGKLFEPLFTTKIKGIGLGLAVSRKLAEANGGRIEVQSTFGKGSTFTVYLPVYEVVPVPTQEK